ncbi:MAG: HAMP domain-containing histidine kinase [Acidobacteria bacterium]|jgi:signal transduction histidine kinase|nr:HAMP domain-containing histidine kinase [Acidobacteriota bacterium]
MRVAGRRKAAVVFLVLGICLVAIAVALNVGWILLNLRQVALLILGVIFFALIITGLILNTIFLVREIRRNEQHDAFLNAVTHELKTPIASIRLYLETLKTREVAEDKRLEFYEIMLTDSNRLLNTVEQVLQAGQTRERKRLLNISQINLEKLLKESVEIIRRRYNLNENTIEFAEIKNNIKVSGDAAELQTVFTNLLDNAVKYSKNNVKILVEMKNSDKKKVEIRIKDSGVGIAQNELKRIFKRFYRVPNLSTQKAKGTGLGLYIVRSIVKKHGGKIWVESKGEEKGSTFIVQLPKVVNGKS